MKQTLWRLVSIPLLAWQVTQRAAYAQEKAAQTTAYRYSAQTTTYRYTLPLSLALEAATESIRVCAQYGYRVSAAIVDMDGVKCAGRSSESCRPVAKLKAALTLFSERIGTES